jgi:hypothetical protein
MRVLCAGPPLAAPSYYDEDFDDEDFDDPQDLNYRQLQGPADVAGAEELDHEEVGDDEGNSEDEDGEGQRAPSRKRRK